ncbi:MAG: 23S rRNA (uracil(1939)-C(5))-methyltransferase RlmD [Elusimicrobiota bacterium]
MNKTTELKIDRLALDGDGIGRLAEGEKQGQAAFVPYSLADEKIKVKLLMEKKNHSRWLPIKILEASPKRIKPACPSHFDADSQKPWCGGCDWQMMSNESQLQTKKQLLIETLERIGGFPTPPVAETLNSPLIWRYRNKVQVPFGMSSKGLVAGFFAPQSHNIIEFDDCLIQTEESVQLVKFVKEYAIKNKWPVYDEDRHRGWIRHLLVRNNEKGEAFLILVTAQENFPDQKIFTDEIHNRFPFVIGIHQNVQSAQSHVILGYQWIHLAGASYIEENVLGLKIRYSPGAFFQVNYGAAQKLYQKALDEMKIEPTDTVLDLYCGVGAPTLLAARKAALVIGIEEVPQAIRDAKINAELNKLKNAEFIEGDVKQVLRESLKLEMLKSSQLIVLLDPPRSGCDPEVLKGILWFKPKRVVYISCHPATLARDLKILSSHYDLKSSTPVDLFPQTSHIESVNRMELKNGL